MLTPSSRKAAYGLTRAQHAHIPTTHHNFLPDKKSHPESPEKARESYDADLANLILNPSTAQTISPSTSSTTTSGDADTSTENGKGEGAEVLEDIPVPDLIICAGWMRILTPSFLHPISAARIRTINLHPALPGEFAGIHAIQRAWAAGQGNASPEDAATLGLKPGEKLKRTGVMIHEVIAEVDAGEVVVTREVEIREGEGVEGLEERIHGVEHGLIVEGARRVLEGIRQARNQKTESA